MSDVPLFQTEQDLVALKGQEESIRLDFKASAKLSRPKHVDELSEHVSAFANTEGGQLIIGIREEKKGKIDIAGEIDEGLDSETFSLDSFRQALEQSISPPLAGLRFLRIPLPSRGPTRFAVNVVVPQSSTVHQAKNHVYYGRGEFGKRPLEDLEVRLRMLRPRVAVGQMAIAPNERIDIGETTHYVFDSEVLNIGPITIDNLVLLVRFDIADATLLDPLSSENIRSGRERRIVRNRAENDGFQILPGDRLSIPSESWRVVLPRRTRFSEPKLTCAWRLLIHDAPPSFGIIDLTDLEFQRHGAA